MKKSHDNPGWLGIVAPIVWIVTRVLGTIFEDAWDKSNSVPYHSPHNRREGDPDEDHLESTRSQRQR